MFYVLKCVLFLLASFLKCFLSFKLNFLYASGFPAKKPLSLVSEFFDLIFILNFVYASQLDFMWWFILKQLDNSASLSMSR